ncbi:hypothetical protein [Paracoccus fontiphilus]|uniref:Uncharacterized protein n=1 Tax=Paracoccus fontiphilus TaxID=1815556 RepID=A0ABV7IGW3_9RHOB|nr:hypothetical protein [Paracoccus fontiphilus]
MTDDRPTIEEMEQHEIAATILLGALRLTLASPARVDRETAAAMLMVTPEERDRQGDYGAAKLLDEWAQEVGELLGDEE